MRIVFTLKFERYGSVSVLSESSALGALALSGVLVHWTTKFSKKKFEVAAFTQHVCTISLVFIHLEKNILLKNMYASCYIL